MFVSRLISGIVLVILAVLLTVCGGNVLLGSTLLISLIGMFELYRVLKMEKTSLAGAAYLGTILYYLNLCLGNPIEPLLIFMAVMIAMMFLYVFAFPKYDAKQVMAAFFGLFYIGVMLSYVYRIRTLENGLYLTFLIFLCSWGCDTCAYCVGVLIGKHKMSPVLSPKKSIEGAVGGVLGTVLLTALYTGIFRSQMGLTTMEIGIISAISAVAALISMVGDLCASAIKRNYEIKDYGRLIPGHGGIMDRFDSMMITAPIIYYLAFYLM